MNPISTFGIQSFYLFNTFGRKKYAQSQEWDVIYLLRTPVLNYPLFLKSRFWFWVSNDWNEQFEYIVIFSYSLSTSKPTLSSGTVSRYSKVLVNLCSLNTHEVAQLMWEPYVRSCVCQRELRVDEISP